MLNNEQFEEKTINRKEIYSRKIIDVAVDKVRLPDGGTSKRGLISHPGGARIIALSEHDRLPFVKRFRKPLEKVILETPVGKIDPEEGENPETTTARELGKETGYRAKSLSHLISMYLLPGFVNKVPYIYHIQGVEKVEDPLVQDEGRVLKLYHLTFEEV